MRIRLECEKFLTSLENITKTNIDQCKIIHKNKIEQELARVNWWRKLSFRKPLTELDPSKYKMSELYSIWAYQMRIDDFEETLDKAKKMCEMSSDGFIEIEEEELREMGLLWV